jgi:thiamine-monophosphate kinase
MPENKNKLTELSEIGEFGLIKRLTKNIKLKNQSTIKGVGDDAAVLYYGGNQIVVTTDLLMAMQ